MSTTYRVLREKEETVVRERQGRRVYESDLLNDGSIDPVSLKVFSHRKEQFFQIEKGAIFPNTLVDFSVFKQKRLVFHPVIEAGPENPVLIEKGHIDYIKQDPICELAIYRKDIKSFRGYINRCIESQTTDEGVMSSKRAVVIKENSKIIIQDIMSNPRSGEKIKEMRGMMNNIIDSIINDRDMIYNLLSLSKFDYYTYTHCLNVGVLSIGLGIAIGIDGQDLKNLGLGAALHDVGKTAISPEILNKQGKLDEYEYMTIQQHVNEGVNMLADNPEFPKEAVNAVLQHHEKMSGLGYPNKLRDKEISLFGKITGISDCYDALTTSRPYKSALSPFNALTIIAKEKTDYDGELLKVFVKMLGRAWG